MMRAKPKGTKPTETTPIETVDKKRIEESEDNLVMVFFPMETWKKVGEMARKIGIETAAVLSIAIEKMDEEMRKAEENGS